MLKVEGHVLGRIFTKQENIHLKTVEV